MSLPSTAARPDPSSIDQCVVLRGISWEQYEALLVARGDDPGPRMTYAHGVLELMSPSIHHEKIKKCLARLVEAWCDANDVLLEGAGSWTLKDLENKQGLEPDECYFVGATDGPAPHLAIEVVWTNTMSKLPIYLGLGVREVWVWDDHALWVHALHGDRYEPVAASEVLPGIDLPLLARLCALPQRDALRTLRALL